MKKITINFFTAIGILALGAIKGQNLTEVTNIKFWEHHSSDINNGANYGTAANGTQSGYDFVNHTYYNSFNTSNSGAYYNGEEMNIDMVEHNGHFGNSSGFGFTSGVSTIWNGSIKGNNLSQWVLASNSFDYASSSDVLSLKNEYEAGTPSNSIAAVQENEVYISKIRNTNLYVAVKCYNVTNIVGNPSGTVANAYFNFDYKYGTIATVGVSEIEQSKVLIYPNPSTDFVNVISEAVISDITIFSIEGKMVYNGTLDLSGKVDISSLIPGTYQLVLVTKDGERSSYKILKK